MAHKTNYRVPFGTVSVTSDARKLIDKALKTKWVTQGQYVRSFEEKFAKLFGVKEAVAVSSGTDADTLALATLYDFGAKRGDEVIIPALSFIATGNAVLNAGFNPVFVDVERKTLNINPEKIEAAITPKTRAIMPVHLMGKPADMGKIMALAKKYKLFVIEDAAEAHGAEYRGQLIGSIGDMAAFSLYAAHIVTTIEGGIITTNDSRLAGILRSLRNHGMEHKFVFKRVGFSSKMNEIEAAVGLGNIKIFSKILAKRRRNMKFLIENFKQFDRYLFSIQEEPYEKLGPHAFPVTLTEEAPFTRDEIVAYIDKAGIDSRNLFYSMPTQCPGYKFLGYKLGDFPQAEYFGNYGFHIGVHQDLGIENLKYVIEVIKKFLKSKGK
ncbi:MAG: DegT/DnrJ/EryC1/StrS family aminotransferase [Candidatus Omnitrophota bacterium]